MGQARDYELSEREIQQILHGQIEHALNKVLDRMKKGDSNIAIRATFSYEVKRILKGELVYTL
jgi:hypothetical protein